MSGHSKWSKIKRDKGANDAKRGAVFTTLISTSERDSAYRVTRPHQCAIPPYGGGNGATRHTLSFFINLIKQRGKNKISQINLQTK